MTNSPFCGIVYILQERGFCFMTIQSNPNFLRVSEYKHPVSLSQVLRSVPTYHLHERASRVHTAIMINNGAEIDRAFLVDKGHPNGAEIHYVTKNGCIFICNSHTFRFITVLIARPNQVQRLYAACGLTPNPSIIARCCENVKKNLNNL